MQTVDIDIRGQLCPSCLLLTLKELNRLGAQVRIGSAEIVVITDDRQATATIPAAADRMGFATTVQPVEGGYRIRIFGRS
jgi:TusA-related sulfurtransferase